MEVLSAILTILPILIHIYHKIEQSTENNSPSISPQQNSYVVEYEFSETEKLEIMNIDSLVVCYNSTTKLINYSPKKVAQILSNNAYINEIIIKEIIVRKNCVYLNHVWNTL